MKTIVIPAHCSESALKLFKLSLSLYREEVVACWFLNIRAIPGNYNDLLTINRTPVPPCVFDASFRTQVQQLIDENQKHLSFHIDHIYGDSPYVFRNYLRYREADLVIYDKQEWQNSKKETGLNIFKMVRHCDCELMYVSGGNELLSNTSSGQNIGNAPQPAPAFAQVPASVRHQFAAVDEDLSNHLQQQRMVSVKMHQLSRYFLKETALQKMMAQANCSLLLVQK